MKKIVFFIFLTTFCINAFAQTVAIDASLTESPISLKVLSGTIAGMLVMPKSVKEKIPVVLIIADAGATDMDGNNAKTGIQANSYKILANELGKQGIATVRYDKRMVGRSLSNQKESQLHFEDYSDDAVSLINMLNDDQRFSKIILFGHGEGSLVAMLAAYQQPIKGFVSAEGFADRGEKILLDEMKAKPKFLADEVKTILDSLKKGKTYEKVDLSIYYIARPSIQPFIMSWCRYDPLRGIKSVKAPILIIQGTTDLQVPVNNGERLKKAKSDAIYAGIPNMNHQFKEAPADEEQNAAVNEKPNLPLKPEMIKAVVDFVNKVK